MVTVEPGVITGDIHRVVEAEGLFYPPDPASLDSCTIGGNVAEGAGGKLVKNVTGYNLTQLLVGSEGTLAVVTKTILRLIPLPKVQVDLLVPFAKFQDAADAVSDIIAHRILPTTRRDQASAARNVVAGTHLTPRSTTSRVPSLTT